MQFTRHISRKLPANRSIIVRCNHPPVKVGDIVELECSDLGSEGQGVCKLETSLGSYVLFVNRTTPGERLTALVTDTTTDKRFGQAQRQQTLSLPPSTTTTPDITTSPPCPHFNQNCGGCQLQHLSYDYQLEWKQRKVLNTFNRVVSTKANKMTDDPTTTTENITHHHLPIIPSPEMYKYRNKMEFSFSHHPSSSSSSSSSSLICGMHHGGSASDILPIQNCMLQSDGANHILKHIIQLLGANKHIIQEEKEEDMLPTSSLSQESSSSPLLAVLQKCIQHLTIRTSSSSSSSSNDDKKKKKREDMLLILTTDNKNSSSSNDDDIKEAVDWFVHQALLPSVKETSVLSKEVVTEIVGIVHHHHAISTDSTTANINNNSKRGKGFNTNTTTSKTTTTRRVVYGQPHLTHHHHLSGLSFKTSATSFFQTNSLASHHLINTIQEACALQPGDVLLDLYCGVGSIGLSLAGSCKWVIGVEVSQQSIGDAKVNAEGNGVKNASFYGMNLSMVHAKKLGEMVGMYIKRAVGDGDGNGGDGNGERGERGEREVREVREGEREGERGGGNKQQHNHHHDADVIIVDPARAGLSSNVVRYISEESMARRVVYVSCNPATQARDCGKLLEGGKYRLSSTRAVDMFPQTPHVESVFVFDRIAGV